MTTIEPGSATEKARLSFHVTGREKDYSRRPQGIPVEVRHDDLTMAVQTLTTETVDLEPGRYLVMVQLPEGGDLLGAVTLTADEDAELQLSPPSEVPHPPEPFPSAPEASDVEAAADLEAEDLRKEATQTTSLHLRTVTGNVLSHDYAFYAPDSYPAEVQVEKIRSGAWKITSGPDNPVRPTLVQVGAPQWPVWNVAVPPGAFLIISQPFDEPQSIRLGFDEAALDEFLQYRSRGLLREAKSMALAMKAEDLLYQKIRNPTGAVVGAYALLAFGELERLHHWTENLMNWFDELPDGLTIRGEHLARLGEHEKAIRCFGRLSERGLPFFSDGVMFALRRLRYYRSVGADAFPAEISDRASATLARLDTYLPFLSLSRPITSFTGLDPAHPNASVSAASDMSEDLWQPLS